MGGKEITHADMVDRARRWLLSNPKLPWEQKSDHRGKCGVVLTEVGAYLMAEVPDAIGWWNGLSFLVECKISRSDFLADFKKYFREMPYYGMGNFRYYMVSDESIATVDEIPDKWGLLKYDGRKLTVLKRAAYQQENSWAERELSMAVWRKLQFNTPVSGLYCNVVDELAPRKTTAVTIIKRQEAD